MTEIKIEQLNASEVKETVIDLKAENNTQTFSSYKTIRGGVSVLCCWHYYA